MAAWLGTLKRWLGKSPVAPGHSVDRDMEEGSGEELPAAPVIGEQGAAHGGHDPDPIHYGRRRLKETFTSHWDLDYLPREEVERIAQENKKKN